MAGSDPAAGAERAVGERVLSGSRLQDQSFYDWRKKLGASGAVSFALVDAGASGSGDRLRIAPGADAATLRTVLNVLRDLV